MSNAIDIRSLTHRYGDTVALADVSLTIASGEVFGLVGPNGGGKSTLFRILSTIMRPTSGTVSILGLDVIRSAAEVRSRLGVVFQSPALDKKLTGRENLMAQGYLYGLKGAELKTRVHESLQRLGVANRADERVETLSGGMKRRLEIAKGLLHHPAVLLLDEPTTGLDPAVRSELWDYLRELNSRLGITIVATTHLMEEAEACHRIALLDNGRILAQGKPAELRASVGGDVISIRSLNPDKLKTQIESSLAVTTRLKAGEIRIEKDQGQELVSRLMAQFAGEIESITLGKPTLDDFFIQKTGRRIIEAGGDHG
jgi:ABC-2 type transport system ATP-binding protein